MRLGYQPRRGDGAVATFTALLAGSGVLIWMLHRPTSRLSQWLDREVDRAIRLPVREVW